MSAASNPSRRPLVPWSGHYMPHSVCLGPKGVQLVFAMHLGHNRSRVRRAIAALGGVLQDPNERDSGHTRLLLLDPEQKVAHNWAKGIQRKFKESPTQDAFSYQYVLDCEEAGKLLPLDPKYWIGRSSFSGNYDPLDVAKGRTNWVQLEATLGLNKSVLACNSSEVCSDFEDSDDGGEPPSAGPSGQTTSNFKSGRAAYLKSEQEQILKYIIRKKAFGQLKGNTLWQQMEADKVCAGRRSWQSLKEHFRKTLRVNLKPFQLGADVNSRFQRGWDGDYINEHDSEGEDGSKEPEKERRGTSETQKSVKASTSSPNALHASGSSTSSLDEPAIPNGQGPTSPEKEIANREEQSSEEIRISSPSHQVSPKRRAKKLFSKASQHLFEEAAESGRRGRKNAKTSEGIVATLDIGSPFSSAEPDSPRLRQRSSPTKSAAAAESPPPPTSPAMSPRLSRSRRHARNGIDYSEESQTPAEEVKKQRRRRKKKSPNRSDETSTASSSQHLYSPEEDAKLQAYVEDNGVFHLHKGNLLWKRMEREALLPGRTWQSMKNRFLKNLAAYVDVTKSKENALANESVAKDISGEKQFYTLEEDEAILRFILDNDRYADVKGNALWELMYDRAVVNRSAQSMKERFRKTIRRNLGRYELTSEERAKLE